jgi:hypothetical protein
VQEEEFDPLNPLFIETSRNFLSFNPLFIQTYIRARDPILTFPHELLDIEHHKFVVHYRHAIAAICPIKPPMWNDGLQRELLLFFLPILFSSRHIL